MGILSDGLHGPFRGRIGNIIYYMLDDKNVSRKIGVSKKPRTEGQRKNMLLTKLCSAFFCEVKDFINTGYSVEVRLYGDNAYNHATKNNKKTLLRGNFPHLEFNYDQILLSKGDLKPAENPSVDQTAHGLEFTWQTDPKMAWPDAADQVMMLAYFPDENRTAYELFGNTRISGAAVLEIPPSLQGAYMETYISFISADRKRISDSVYLGSLNKPEVVEQSFKKS